ncbi:tetraacyldisaccharide 4'-kinase [Bacteroides pyogenes F0041]|uniref:Tetraacyldisaccharide 4'-kinase n=1 Tax=Bacteroides pyogenes F0041 TaxID=1321819 RepID=U2CMI3_9BACE|nr:tetraacyldisaccharide 4'-kinase [Bacteroides pyogenes]ERI85268.1 tetraacyldisaccharide 4'-kinase [Bacteroides pyogenes F0041]MBB3896535.1 tetraacyldisaccharide 4'-kinase [Bacteroides pyogenes]GAE23953.1 tetraacyldisaccharide 4'-kinase [Bacteroides pyogenes JCM 10003]SUV32804.1 tetraacyldisaccharide 4'-kinase [Bacteroides pyogenes]
MDEHFTKIHKWLYPVSWLYGAVVRIRNKFFDWGVLQSKSFDAPIICIGNLAIGGTGKTPHTEYLIKLLHRKYRVAVLSRGYKRKSKGYVKATAESTAYTIGDEPYQMYVKYPSIVMAVDENRCHGIEKLLALKDPTVDVVLLDDAFQHRYVKPGLNILLTDYNRLFCDDALLPAGRLREPVDGKNRAQIVIVTKCPENIKPIDYNIITKRIGLYPYQQLYFSSFRYGDLKPAFSSGAQDTHRGSETIPLSALTNTEVVLVTGIASPADIKEKLKEHTATIEMISFDDHHQFTHRDLQFIRNRFEKLNSKERLIITTDKDISRLIANQALDEALKPFIYILPIEVEILQNQQNKFNQHIINYVRENSRNRNLSERKDAYLS